MRATLLALSVLALAGCGSKPLTDSQAPGWSQSQAADYVRQRELVGMMRRNDPGLAAAIRRQAEDTAPSAGLAPEEARIREGVRRTMMAEDDREAEARCQAHYQGFVAPLIVALPLHAQMRADRDNCVTHFRATGEMPPIPH